VSGHTIALTEDEYSRLLTDRFDLIQALRELSQATLAAAQCLNRSAKGEGCDLSEWMRARQKMDKARKRANALLAKYPKAPA
jgi:hypothetical protein